MQIEKLTEKTLALLEYPAVMEQVAVLAASAEAAEIIRNERPLCETKAVEKTKELVQVILDRINSRDDQPDRGIPSIGFLLPKLEVEGASLDLDEAFAIGVFIECGTELQNWLLKGENSTEGNSRTASLKILLESLPGCGAVAAEIFKVVDSEGKIRDLPSLRTIKQRIRSLNADLENTVARYTSDEETKRMLQSAVPSQRDGRMVLAVKANFRGRVRGIVHEVSATGQTLFVEPEDVVEKNNEILIEKHSLDVEIAKILRELSYRIAGTAFELNTFYHVIIELECLRAKAKYSREIRGHFAHNSVTDDSEGGTGGIILKQARHPLIPRAVPIDFSMSSSIRTLIITGPNTGGKTVALKTAGLFALLNQSGLALPLAEGSVLPIFDAVYADIGDEQSIGQSLSTFSAHITNIAAITANATEKSLVLLDELGSGTDPEEGSAIAMAILDYLIEKKSRLVITTHHGILKNYGYTQQGVENASVEFDLRTLSPTFRIVNGIPGESRALDIAAKNGLSCEIVAGARTYLDEERSDVSALISGLKEKHRELDDAAQKADVEKIKLREERRLADLKELRLRQKEAELKAGTADKLRLLLNESRKTLENLVRELREGELTKEKTRKVKEFLNKFAHNVDEENIAIDAEERAIAGERRRIEADCMTAEVNAAVVPLAPGVEVFAGKYRQRGIIIRLDKKTASGNFWLVETGSLKISFNENDLVPAAPSNIRLKPIIAAADLVSSGRAAMELNLLGMRLEEALESLRRQIDAAVLSGLKDFAVVHGKGDGILQEGVHRYLKSDPAVADYYFSRPEMGGFGRTEVILR